MRKDDPLLRTVVMVRAGQDGKSSICTGFIFTDTTIGTAAHCLVG